MSPKKTKGSRKSYALALFLCLVILNFISTSFVFAKGPPLVPNIPADFGGAQLPQGKGVIQKLLDFLASPLTWVTSKVVVFIALVTNYIIAFLGSFLLMLASWFVDFALTLNGELMNMGVVRIGWAIVRDLTNMLFVLGIIVIAFATILRIESYGVKQTLWKLIAMAVLINFSLTIAGVFLDFAGIITQFFIDKATGDGTISLGSSMANAFQPQKLWAPGELDNVFGNTSNNLANMLESIVSVFFTTFFSFLGVITFIGVGVMLLIRVIRLAFYLILAPIAWFAWIFPGISVGGTSLWNKWWSEFIKWTFFAPIVSFFIYLSLYTLRVSAENDGLSRAINQSKGSAAEFSKKLMFENSSGSTIAQMVVLVGLMWGSLIIANALGIEGAKAFSTAATWGSNKVKGWAKSGAGKAGDRILRAGQRVDEEGGRVRESFAQRSITNLSTIPVVGRIFRPLSEAVSKRASFSKDDIEKLQKEKYDRLNSRDRLNRGNSITGFADPKEAAALAASLAKNDEWEKINESNRKILTEFSRRTGTEKMVLEYSPHFAEEFGKTIKDVMAKIPGGKYDSINKKAFENPLVTLHSSIGGLEKIAKEGNEELIAAVVNGFNRINRESLDEIDAGRYDEKKKFFETNVNYSGRFPRTATPPADTGPRSFRDTPGRYL